MDEEKALSQQVAAAPVNPSSHPPPPLPAHSRSMALFQNRGVSSVASGVRKNTYNESVMRGRWNG